MVISKTFAPVLLTVAVSLVMAGCGGGSGGDGDSSAGMAPAAADSVSTPDNSATQNGSSPAGGADQGSSGSATAANGTATQPDGCTTAQYNENGSCHNKTVQSIQPLVIKRFLTGQAYTLSLKTSQNLPVKFASTDSVVCDFVAGELKVFSTGKCMLTLTQEGTSRILPFNDSMTVDVISPDAEASTDINACQAGQITEAERQTFINAINEVRALHHLPKMTYDYEHEDQMMQAALVLTANNRISHYPDSGWTCFSDIAYQGTTTSNLNLGSSSGVFKDTSAGQHVLNWLTEQYSADLGHRRHILNPFLTKTSFGQVLNSRAAGGGSVMSAAMKTIYAGTDSVRTTAAKGVIAYPYENYPIRYFLKSVPLSLSILDNQSGAYSNRTVNFSQAKLTVTRRDTGQVQTISNIKYDNSYTGLPNNLQFNFSAVENDVIYDVKVSNVLVGDVAKDFSYWFKIDSKVEKPAQ
ncbi:CAP domain-containing protein [Acinetobacter sp. WZC-1]|uniref:CAP domain-containing protein n=1 Tax=Acinetobacter sp. WZC-1 TaxID=3459034 RepID=UPI00403D7747